MLDAEKRIDLTIYDEHSLYTCVQVEIPYLNKTVEVNVPNNIQVGHKIRLKQLGYEGENGVRGDLFLVINKIQYRNRKSEEEQRTMQKMMVVEYNDFNEVNQMLQGGWIVKEFKPFKDSPYLYVYVLLEKNV